MKTPREQAADLSTPREKLVELASHPGLWIRFEVGKNPNTPVEVLQKLANDEEDPVRQVVAWNLKTPLDTLYLLSQDTGSAMVQREARNNPKWKVANEDPVFRAKLNLVEKWLL